jgi:N-methylhydantoinase A
MASRIGVDIGGTFTDLIYFDDQTGQILVGKAPTVPSQPEIGCIEAINQVGLGSRLADVEYFLHGTTVGLNALLERRGAIVGLLCTAGFRDVLEIRRGDRNDMYNLNWTPPDPLVPRRLRLGVRGRVLVDRSVSEPLNVDDVREALEIFRGEGVTAIAVAYMNAYANGALEIETERVLREAGWDGAISLSHRVSGEYREYERTSTTVVDAFVRARISDYLARLESGLRREGFRGTCLITRSGGGSMTFAEADERPFETIMSGPVAGAEGAAELSRRLGLGDLITADVGGTSFDSCVIVNGRTQLLYQGKIADHPLLTPWVDVRSIGTGGGSIARVDAGGLLVVGPESAGAVPGPACYGRGGSEPTVTDAAFYLGMLGDGRLASGLVLDRSKAEAALQRVATALDYDIALTARGIMAIVGSSMANTIREITIEGGLDPRKMTLLAFGGAGPLMATELARELDIAHIVVPPHAGNFSAWGLLGADLVQSRARTRIMRLSGYAITETNAVLEDLFASLIGGEDLTEAGTIREVGLDMRFAGQEHTLTVSPASVRGRLTSTLDELRATFIRDYANAFETTLDGDIEVVSIRASVRRPLPRRDEAPPTAVTDPQSERRLEAFSFAEGRSMEFAIVDRFAMPVGSKRAGPLIIVEPTTTTYVDSDFDTEIDAAGCLHLLHRRA